MGFDKQAVSKAIQKGNHAFNIVEIKNKCYTKLANLKIEYIPSDEPIKFKDLDKSLFRPIHKDQKWADKFGCAWFHFTGKVPQKGKGSRVVLRIKLHGEGLVFNEDGIILQGITQIVSKGDVFHALVGKQIVDIANPSNGDEDVNLYIDAGFNGKLRFENLSASVGRCDISIANDDVLQYYYDYIDLFFLMINLETSSARFKEIDKALNKSMIEFRKNGATAAREALKPAIYPIDYPCTEFTAIGHAHIDLAWLWPIRETKRKVARTFSNQLRNLKIYDDFVFAESQPQMFQWLKEEYPELFERVKEQVNLGRIELQGKNWVEGDCNLTSGESWIRQSLYGDKFWKENFNQNINMCWLPDVFGFPASLPQVIKKCGMDYFMTIKLLSNTVNQFPYKTFNWKGIDGTSVIAHMEPLGDYNSGASPFAIFKSNKRNTEKEIVNKALLIYGDGDGGGGPGEGHIEYVRRHKNLNGLAPCVMRKAVDFFDDISNLTDIIPTHQGDLYYERHQGSYTSQANSKKANRRIEELLHYVEWLGAEAKLRGISYDRELVEKIWKEVLLYQFHDILPGTSIKRVYDESIPRYNDMTSELNAIKNKLLDKMSQKEGITAVNYIDFKQEGYKKHNEIWYEYDVDAYSTSNKLLDITDKKFDQFKSNEYMIENRKLRVTFNENGVITSILDKSNNNRELVKSEFNKLTIYSDPFMYYNAWDINIDYPNMKKWDMKLISSVSYIDGPTIVRENSFEYNKSKLVQKVILTADDNLIRFDTTVDWQEEHKMLRADFIPTVYSNEVTCNIQFGNFKRTTTEKDSIEKARFEVCAHKFVNLDSEDYGFALLNNCKYGHRAKNGLLSLALLRAPKFPDKTCDIGVHTFSYAILPHKEKFEESDVLKRGYIFNNPVDVIDKNFDLKSAFAVNNDAVVIETIKVSEDNLGVVIRLYEAYGNETNFELINNSEFKTAKESDMLENVQNDIDIKSINIKPFEIKTIILTK